jgi:ABC-2 type transport system ATP-binding protein
MSEASRPLEANGIVKMYGNKRAVDGISVHVDKGECFALLGPNGAGKTTLCEILEGLRDADQGEISLFGMSLKENRDEILQKVGVQLQETNLYGRFTVKETLELFSSFYNDPISVDEIIKLMKLEAKENDILKNLSGGQKQRVYLGSSLINQPELLFLDEPTTGLDPQARRQIWEIISDIKKQGRSILLTTHYMEEAESLADRIAIQDHGKIIAEGTPNGLILEHIGKEIISLNFAESADLSKVANEILDSLEFVNELPIILENTIEISTDNSAKHSIELLEFANKNGHHVTGLSMRKGSLEDVFLKLTGRSIRND